MLGSNLLGEESLPRKYKDVDFRTRILGYAIYLDGHNGKAIRLTTTGMGGSIKLIGGEYSKSEITLINGEGDGFITILNKEAKSGLALANKQNGGDIEIIKDNKTYAKLNVKEHGANFAIAGQKGNIGIGFDELGGNVIVSDDNYYPRVSITNGEYGGMLAIHDNAGNTKASLEVGELGGIVGIYSNDGKTKASIEDSDFGGNIRIFDNNANAMAMLSAFSFDMETSAGILSLLDNDGNLKSVLGAKNGHGFLEIDGIRNNAAVYLGSDEFGGNVQVYDVAEKPKAGLVIDRHGNGRVFALDQNGNSK